MLPSLVTRLNFQYRMSIVQVKVCKHRSLGVQHVVRIKSNRQTREVDSCINSDAHVRPVRRHDRMNSVYASTSGSQL